MTLFVALFLITLPGGLALTAVWLVGRFLWWRQRDIAERRWEAANWDKLGPLYWEGRLQRGLDDQTAIERAKKAVRAA